MREAKSIVVRWAEAKARVLAQQGRLDAICAAVSKDVRAACGQIVAQAALTVSAHTFALESWWGRVQFSFQFSGTGQCSSSVQADEHWGIGLDKCERLADVMESIRPEQIRLAYESTL